uniref:Uncharacterized protein n=1 Tax=Rhizophora mucronata TaxID=61149 RepID=A0A2P2Q6J8_RHIMU
MNEMSWHGDGHLLFCAWRQRAAKKSKEHFRLGFNFYCQNYKSIPNVSWWVKHLVGQTHVFPVSDTLFLFCFFF